MPARVPGSTASLGLTHSISGCSRFDSAGEDPGAQFAWMRRTIAMFSSDIARPVSRRETGVNRMRSSASDPAVPVNQGELGRPSQPKQ